MNWGVIWFQHSVCVWKPLHLQQKEVENVGRDRRFTEMLRVLSMFLLSASTQEVRRGNAFGVATKVRDGKTTVRIPLIAQALLTLKTVCGSHSTSYSMGKCVLSRRYRGRNLML